MMYSFTCLDHSKRTQRYSRTKIQPCAERDMYKLMVAKQNGAHELFVHRRWSSNYKSAFMPEDNFTYLMLFLWISLIKTLETE